MDCLLHYGGEKPGWSETEKIIFKLLLQKFGIGHWKQILDTNLLPGKYNPQLVGMTQRLLGSQSIAIYSGLKLDIDRIKTDNDAKQAFRKCKMIVNDQGTLTKEDIAKLKQETQQQYGLSASDLENVERKLQMLLKTRYMLQQSEANLLRNLSEPMEGLRLNQQRKKLAESLQIAQSFINQIRISVLNLENESPQILQNTQQSTQPQSIIQYKETSDHEDPEEVYKATDEQAKDQVVMKSEARSQRQSEGRGKKRKVKTMDVEETLGPSLVNEYMQKLVDMGFTKRMAKDALAEVEYDVDAAALWLLQNVAT